MEAFKLIYLFILLLNVIVQTKLRIPNKNKTCEPRNKQEDIDDRQKGQRLETKTKSDIHPF